MKSAFFDRFSFSASSSSHALMRTARIAQMGEKAAMSFTNIQTYCAGWDLRGDKASRRYVIDATSCATREQFHTGGDQVSGSM